MNNIIESIRHYASNCSLEIDVDFTLQQDNGEGIYVKDWYVEGIVKPTQLQLETISIQINDACVFNCLKEEKLLENQANFDSIRNGIKVIDNVPINIDPTSCLNIVGQNSVLLLNIMTQSTPLPVTWFDDNNLPNEYTREEFMVLGQTVATTIFLIQQKLSANKIAIEAATSIQELNAIDTNFAVYG
jgi:hypothetical protein